ncbi:MAG TPA: MATE family efflux transporter [Bryobacteraceae bacterium]|nr:MATE family efflux transporter [Bryobacteraceae bacterium]
MSALDNIRREWRPLLALAWPLVLAELGWMAMGIVDTIMVGRLPDSAAAIGAVSLGSILFYTCTVFGGCLLLGLDTVVSQAYGAGRLTDCHRSLWSALYLCAALTPALMMVNAALAAGLPRFGVNPRVLPQATAYIRILNWGTFPLMLYFAVRRYLQGIALVQPVMFALVSANLINVFGNWVLIYGHMGFRAMGTDGSAWATFAARLYMAGVLIFTALYCDRARRSGLFLVPLAPDWQRMARLLKLGIPAATHVVLEIGVFGLTTALIARLDAASLAGHQIALNMASLSFMVPLGISSAAAVRVGHLIGQRDPGAAGRAGWSALACGVAFMSFAAVAFLAIPERIARIYTNDPAVIRVSVTLLAIAAAFQLFDGCQVVAAGALRGTGNTRTPMWCNLVFYWFVGLPLGMWLCFRAGWGAAGLWMGLCCGLILIGSVLLAVWRHTVARLQPDPLCPRPIHPIYKMET